MVAHLAIPRRLDPFTPSVTAVMVERISGRNVYFKRCCISKRYYLNLWNNGSERCTGGRTEENPLAKPTTELDLDLEKGGGIIEQQG